MLTGSEAAIAAPRRSRGDHAASLRWSFAHQLARNRFSLMAEG